MKDDHDDAKRPTDEAKAAGTGREHSPSRRRFMRNIGLSSLAAGAASTGFGSAFAAGDKHADETDADAPGAGKQRVTFKINGQMKQVDVTPNTVLLDAIRQNLEMSGTKKGCDHGQCGACNVHVNGTVINSCLSLAVMHDGDEITTVEGLGSAEDLGDLQQAFWQADGYQCGYCTSGQMMTAAYILKDKRIGTSGDELRQAMSGNLCRCGAYKNIEAAIAQARGKLQGA
ncbi:(2Fe-2S)-binding protein [Salinisphaera sp. Q1T1-3]|uniref:(2Fe-2S)-binding protein n=1 Tax=Salinisphaera sp. Q1T1-3 TaxID=2321229 RepID=UPI000E7254B2|nr:2Fe-2S iron-sulfur cluster-binding protein [Salinisphaera sp. Q1T1-3]RJS95244.1 xanthine dehydrogenase [Salinisphaera sp. Q1T1-3]